MAVTQTHKNISAGRYGFDRRDHVDGIVVKNGIVLIDYTILCRERGMGIIIGSDCRKIPSSPGIDDNVDDRFGYDPDVAVGTGEVPRYGARWV